MTAAPSAVEAPLTSRTLPLLRFTSTYQAVVSTVAAEAAAVTTVSSPPTNTTANAAANPDRHRRRHLAVRANLTDIASFLSSFGIADMKRAPSARTRRHPRRDHCRESGVLPVTFFEDDPRRNMW